MNAIAEIARFLSYPFAVRAIVVGGAVSLCAALLGVTLVLKRYSMIGDGLSHVGFAIFAVSAALGTTGAELYIAIPLVIAAAIGLLRLTESSNVRGDAAIAILSTLSLAVGYIIMYKAGTNVDVNSYMFGSILAMSTADVKMAAVLSVVVLGLFVFCYNKIFAVTFDENFAKATGVSVSSYNVLIAVLTAVTIVLGMRMMGAMLISSLIIFPALTSMRVFKSFKGVVWSSGILSVICFCIGMTASYLCSTPAGASVVLVNLAAFLLFTLFTIIRKNGRR